MAIGDGVGRIAGQVSDLMRFAPEPRSRSGFGTVLNGVKTALGVAGQAAGLDGINPIYVELLNKQLQAQFEMQVVSLESNVEKSKHETQMAPIRNIRVG
ncbi:MAG: hypothetical protein J5J00_04245 [Deltaproteobacteria bacterium]|nr:hypothetical protein [Deltaproteobacteria bacterium]